jgi:16S rRNA (cytosine967-C5)-methyltransferase
MISPARAAAYRVGLSVSSGRSTLADALASARSALADDRDKALAAEIAIGVQRWRATLDHLIAHASRRPITSLDDEVVEILRLSAYQLFRLTRVPASAIVDEAVKLTGRSGKRSASGLVNAVLRTLSRNRRRIGFPLAPPDSNKGPPRTALDRGSVDAWQSVLPIRPSDPTDREAALDYLAITLSHPRWLVARWYARYGFEATEQWLLFNNTPAPLMLRVNRVRHTTAEVQHRLSRQGARVARGRFGPDALVVDDVNMLDLRDADEGWYVVQDEASQLVALLAGTNPGGRVLDTCAAPGGKTTAIAARMSSDSILVACDVRQRRMELLAHTVRSSGATNVRLVQADVLQPLPFRRPFETVFVDAPCSGLGTLRRDPDIKWRRRESDLTALAAAETEMLRHAAACVRKGGRLIYATCSSEPEENEAVVNRFTSTALDFVRVDARSAAPDIPDAIIDADGHLRTYPHHHLLEAFFGAVFERSNH